MIHCAVLLMLCENVDRGRANFMAFLFIAIGFLRVLYAKIQNLPILTFVL